MKGRRSKKMTDEFKLHVLDHLSKRMPEWESKSVEIEKLIKGENHDAAKAKIIELWDAIDYQAMLDDYPGVLTSEDLKTVEALTFGLDLFDQLKQKVQR
jgi:hypothetical protein